MLKNIPIARILIAIFAIWGAVLYILFFISAYNEPVPRAMAEMLSGLILLWVVIGGSLMYLFRDRIKIFVQRVRLGWKARFILLATLLALIEEAVTTSMTNLAPLFGVKIGEAYITASTNYLDVIFFHSVIVFMPMFFAWAWLLSRYQFKPAEVFILFGVTGTLAEIGTFGLQNILMMGIWVFVYGLMVYLPAYTIPEARGEKVKRPGIKHYLLAVIAPIVFAIPMAIFIGLLHHPAIHFNPINGTG
jgi:hypothetical protein